MTRGALDRLRGLGRSRRVAAAVSVVWAVLVLAYAVGFFAASRERGTAFLDGAFFLVMLALPLILVWLAAFLAEELARQRELIAALGELVGPLAASLDATRESLERQPPSAAPGADASADALARLVAGQERIRTAVEALRAAPAPAVVATPAAPPARKSPAATARPPRPETAPEPEPEPASQPDLPLISPPEPEAELGWDDLIRALDFPRDADDEDGFRALRLALRRRSLAQTLQAAEDVMTLLSQHGVYMDDLAVAPPEAAAWRRFAAGARGAEVGAMGGVADDAALATTRGLMKGDPIFRDTALFFQRRFDAALGEFVDGASDADLGRIADTRSGRAFQLLARAGGALD